MSLDNFNFESQVTEREIAERAQRILAEEATRAGSSKSIVEVTIDFTPFMAPITGFGTRALLMRAEPFIARLGTPAKIAAAVLPFAAAGVANDYFSDFKLGDLNQLSTGAGSYGMCLLGLRALTQTQAKPVSLGSFRGKDITPIKQLSQLK